MRNILVPFFVAVMIGCSLEPSFEALRSADPAAAPGVVSRLGSGGGSSSSSAGAGGDGPGYDCPPDPADVCNYFCVGWPAPHPDGCVCGLECPAPSGPCMDVGCSGMYLPLVGGSCSEHLRAPGLWCLGGVGTCDGKGACVPPADTCDPAPPAPVACSVNNADCTDGNPCTKDLCAGLLCANQPEPDGTPCGAGKTCHAGACCAP